jgi:phosphate starvation-inducible PhoH-like protein
LSNNLNSAQTANVFALTPADSKRLANLCGQFNANIKSIEGHFGVRVSNRGNLFQIDGDAAVTREVESLLRNLYAETENSELLKSNDVQGAITRLEADSQTSTNYLIKIRKTTIRPSSKTQEDYLRSIANNTITIGVGPAGTGKTYLAVASAVHALANDSVSRIVLVRPVVEAGERIGFLPGDIEKKVNPYLRPLYDALYEMLGFERVGRLLDRGTIELAPLAFMRGRTLNDSFIILDEAQNTTIEQMKMFLTRIGFNSQVVISGDITQIDLPRTSQSGLRHAIRILSDIKDIGIIKFQNRDIVRHPLVQTIVQAYERDTRENSKTNS